MPARKRDPDEVADQLARLADVVLNMSPRQLAAFEEHLAPADRQLVERIIAEKVGAGWRADPLSMGVHFGALEPLPHSALFARKFRQAVEGVSVRQIWECPPQHGKSIIGSEYGPLWAFDREPDLKLALTSYADQLANEHAIFVRNFLVEHGDDLRARLRTDRRRGDRFVTDEGGGLIAAGVGAGLTGFGAHGIVVDDPFKNWEEAHSEATRLKVWNWYRAVVRTRLNVRRGTDGRAIAPFIIVIQTRWHESDLVGQLIAQDLAEEGEMWDVVRLPAFAEDDDPIGREPGDPLAPSLHDRTDLQAVRLSLGSYLFAGLYQQRPEPEEGGEIKRAWFQFSTSFPPRYDTCLSSWDTKFKDKEGGDFVVGQAWGRTGSAFWCYDQMRGQYSFPATKTAIALMSVRHPELTTHLVENTGNGPETIRDLRAGMGAGYTVDDELRSELGITDAELPKVTAILRNGLTGVVPVNVKGPKPVRVRRNLGVLEARHVHLPVGQDWTGVLVDESASFPRQGVHDDTVDAMTQALDRLKLTMTNIPARVPRQTMSPKPSARAVPRTRR